MSNTTNKKHGIFASTKKGEDLGYFGKITVYENGRKLWEEVLWNVHRLTRIDAMNDAEGVAQEMRNSSAPNAPCII